MNSSILIRCILGLILGLFTACSSFDRQWKRADECGSAATRWEGRWTSEKHHKSDGSPEGGRLRCVLEPIEAQKLAAHFHANWKIFSSNYSTTLEPVPGGPRRDRTRHYRGTQQLPAMFGGTYQYDATITRDRFITRYSSRYDHGTFALQRVLPGAQNSEMHAQH